MVSRELCLYYIIGIRCKFVFYKLNIMVEVCNLGLAVSVLRILTFQLCNGENSEVGLTRGICTIRASGKMFSLNQCSTAQKACPEVHLSVTSVCVCVSGQ